MASTEKSNEGDWFNNLKKNDDEIWAKKPNYYGFMYGSFEWIRGTVYIYDNDDIAYVQKCLNKIKKRLREEKKR